MERIIVNLKQTSYSVFIANGLFDKFGPFWSLNNEDMVVFVTDDRVAPIYLDSLRSVLSQAKIITDQLILPSGEKNKSLYILDMIFTGLLNKNYNRSNTVLVALGGGVIGDITGFAAATYQRGIRFIQAPTTLLAQVDASIGGKTGINHALGKNMIGCFYQPISVLVDISVLSTLTFKEISSGLSEIIKYALAFDVNFFSWLENNIDGLLDLDMRCLMYCIRRCCELKKNVIENDELDRKGIRNLLNLGHTYGHAIESYLGYVDWSHGEAISAGIMIAVSTALRLGKFNVIDAERVKLLLLRAKLPIHGPNKMKPENYLEYILRDKKSFSNKINLVLPVSIGCVKNFFDVNCDLVLESIKDSYN